jgi:serine/threonine-protein kinase RsbT
VHAADLPVTDAVLAALGGCVSSVTARSVLDVALRRAGMSTKTLEREGMRPELLAAIEHGLAMFARDPVATASCLSRLRAVRQPARGLNDRPVEIPIDDENGIVAARVKARTMADAIGFDGDNCIRIVTAVSELARNIHKYAGHGRITLRALSTPRTGLSLVASDQGPGIPHIQDVLDGTHKSRTGLGLGLRGCQRLMDEFTIDTAAGRGTTVRAMKYR